MSDVIVIMRAFREGHWSIERVFSDLHEAMLNDISIKISHAPFLSAGIFRRIGIAIWAWARRARVIHISGDIHFAAVFLRKRLTILTIHDCERIQHLSGLKRRIYLYFWFELPFRRSKIVTTISSKSKDDLISLLGPEAERIRVIPNPISEHFKNIDKVFDVNCPRILQVGTRHNKNLDRVIEALAGIPCVLVILGKLTSPQRSRLDELKIKYEQHVDVEDEMVVGLYGGCDIVVFVSLSEGFGLVAIEAQATGRPVLTSIGPPFDQIVGETAVQVDPYNVNAIRNAILHIINDESFREGLVKSGTENVKRYSAKKIALEYRKIYDEVIADSPQ